MRFALRILLAAAGMAAADAAHADAIDGAWCSPEGRKLFIEGRTLTLWNGRIIEGEYGRHSFRFIAPDGDPDAGTGLLLTLYGETEMHFSRPTGTDIWKRCELVS